MSKTNWLNNRAHNDARSALTGKDGALYDGNGNLMATVDTFLAQYNFTNAKFQPLGSYREHEIPQAVGVTITFTNWVIESEDMLTDTVRFAESADWPEWSFQGVLENRYGYQERIVYYDCIPSGANDIQNLTVGDGIKRNYSLFVNGKIKIQDLL